MKPPFKNISILAPFVALLGAFFLFFGVSGPAAAGWSSPIQLANKDAEQSALVVDPRTGHTHIVWFDWHGIYWYVECIPALNRCSPPVQVRSVSITYRAPRASHDEEMRPALAVDTQGNLYAAIPDPSIELGTAILYRRDAHTTSWHQWRELGIGRQVRIAAAPSDQIDVIWGAGGTFNYRRYDMAGNPLVEYADIPGENPELVTDAFGNAHLVYEGPLDIYSKRSILYQNILSTGEASQAMPVYDSSGNATEPAIALDSANRLHFVWTEALTIPTVRYMRCDAGMLTDCTGPLTLNTDGLAGSQATVTTVGTDFFAAFTRTVGDNKGYVMLYDGSQTSAHALHQIETQPDSRYPALTNDPRTGWLHLSYRYLLDGGLRYRYYASGRTSAPPTSTATPTQTPTPAVTVSPRTSPVNLSQSRAMDRAPAITMDENGNAVVAWEEASGTAKNIVARVAASGGTFGATGQISANASSIRPNVFSGSAETYAVFQEGTSLAYTIRTGDTWAPVSRFGPAGTIVENPQGVRATDGTVWFAWTGTSASRRDIWAMPLNGEPYKLSNSGYAAAPAIAAGDSGTVFVAWSEKGSAIGRNRIKVSLWNGATWTPLPDPAAAGVQPALAYRAGKLEAVWIDGTTVRRRTWDGSAWGPAIRVSAGIAPTHPRVALSMSGAPTIVWADSGKIFIAANGGAPRVISGRIPNASAPALCLDSQDVPHVVFANGEVWHLVNP